MKHWETAPVAVAETAEAAAVYPVIPAVAELATGSLFALMCGWERELDAAA